MARPTKFDSIRSEAILTALRAGNTRTAAAGYAEIDRSTLTTWLHRYPAFLAAVEKAEADAEVAMVANIRKAVMDGTWTAAAWWLERRRHQDWGRKDRLDLVAAVRVLAEREGLSEQETVQAVAEAERYLRELQRADAR